MRTSYVTYEDVCSVVEACVISTLEASKEEVDEFYPVEFLDGIGNLLYSSKEGYPVYPEGLRQELKRRNLMESFEMREVL